MQSISAHSPAKINLTLRVGPRRDDGYHDIESLVAQVGLYDEITISRRDDEKLTLECSDASIPSDETNLALRAARKLADAAGDIECGVHIKLVKNIPAGAGLGGGSSNAATVLKLLNELWRLNIARDDLAKFGATLGSDVPLFFYGPLSIIRGRGEQVEPVQAKLPPWVALILPAIHSSTKSVYAAFDWSPAPPARRTIEEVVSTADWTTALFNDLQPAALIATPALSGLSGILSLKGLTPMSMTGSGAGLFRLFQHQDEAVFYADTVQYQCGTRAVVVRTAP